MLPDKLKMAKNWAMFAHGGAKSMAQSQQLLIRRRLQLLRQQVYVALRAQPLPQLGQQR
jgi:hypothetical protein